ncbi:MAG: diphthine synthase [Nitrososphaera sp.]|nr:diphthine synthase [Nitrososphaera sp.]
MLYLVGAGINGYKGLSLAAIEALKDCDVVYAERFTSSLSDSQITSLNSIIGKQVKIVQRWFVEDGREILEDAASKKVAIITYGDPLIATTHSELRVRAARKSIKTRILHAASGIPAIMGEAGLHMYKFGRTVTMMSEPKSAISVYSTIFDNLLAGNHTLILSEYSFDEKSEPFFLDPPSIFKMLLEVENDQKHGVFSENTFALAASRIGADDQTIVSGKVKSLQSVDYGNGPHTVIIPGNLHFTEEEGISALTRCIDKPTDNTQPVRRISVQMVERYAPKAKQAAEQMKIILRADDKTDRKGMFEVLENAEYYISDAERFLGQGKHELAVLSIGYAEGLIDSLRFQKGINPWLQ